MRTEARGRQGIANNLLSARGAHCRHVPRAADHRRETLMASHSDGNLRGAWRLMVEGDNIYLQLVKFQFLRRHPKMPRTSFRCDPCARVHVKGQRLRTLPRRFL